jgi:hypothetical protein
LDFLVLYCIRSVNLCKQYRGQTLYVALSFALPT